jgi:hypothetical protein
MADAPAAPSGGGGGNPQIDQAKGLLDNPMMVLILGFFTCGIIPLWWMWTRTKEMNAALGKQQVNPMFVFPGCICFPVFWYASWLFAQGFHEMKKKKGGDVKDEILLHTILMILIMPVGQFLIQQQLNEMSGKKV